MDIDIPEGADEDETAAIVAVLNAYVGMQVRAAAEESAAFDWNDRRWSFSGRVRGVGKRAVRVPDGTPRDPWTASNRLRRMR